MIDVNTLIKQALEVSDDGEYRKRVRELKFNPSGELLGQLRILAKSKVPKERMLAADVLAEYGLPKRYDVECSRSLLSEMILNEDDKEVRKALAFALGHTKVPTAVKQIITWDRGDDEELRRALVTALTNIDNEEALTALLRFMQDPSEEVRDWATFAVGSQTKSDSPLIRDRLLMAAGDVSPNVRFEAISGLLNRGDSSAVGLLRKELRREVVESWVLELVADCKNPLFLDDLHRIASQEISNDVYRRKLEHALRASEHAKPAFD